MCTVLYEELQQAWESKQTLGQMNPPVPSNVFNAKPDRKAAVNRTRRTRVVAGGYRTRWPRANGVAQFDTQYLNQDTAFSQWNFQTGPRQHRRAKDSSRPPEDATSVAGGPFVNPPGR